MNPNDFNAVFQVVTWAMPTLATLISAFVTYRLRIGILELEIRIKDDLQKTLTSYAQRGDLTDVVKRLGHLERKP